MPNKNQNPRHPSNPRKSAILTTPPNIQTPRYGFYLFQVYCNFFYIVCGFYNILQKLRHILENGGKVLDGFGEIGVGVDEVFLVLEGDGELLIENLLALLDLF